MWHTNLQHADERGERRPHAFQDGASTTVTSDLSGLSPAAELLPTSFQLSYIISPLIQAPPVPNTYMLLYLCTTK